MQSHRALIIVAVHMIQRTDFDDAGVVDQDVNPVEMIDHFPDSSLNLIAIEQIALHSENFPVARSKIGFRPSEFLWVTRDESDLSALVANVSGQHKPESARPAGDENYFIPQGVLRGANDASSYPTTEQKSACAEPDPSIHFHNLIIRYEAPGASGCEEEARRVFVRTLTRACD
jgi:hypothetical protein